MRVGNYSLVVPEGVERESGYVGLPHGKQYTVRFMSHEGRRCDVEVKIDGKEIGTFRLHGHQSGVLERSPDDRGRFTFYADATAEAEQAGIALVPNADRGLIQVRFVPEKYRPPVMGEAIRTSTFRGGAGGQSVGGGGGMRSMGLSPDTEEKTSGGITGLSGHSDQNFVTVGPIDRDEEAAVLISVRLVAVADGPRPLRPAVVRANAVPPPVT